MADADAPQSDVQHEPQTQDTHGVEATAEQQDVAPAEPEEVNTGEVVGEAQEAPTEAAQHEALPEPLRSTEPPAAESSGGLVSIRITVQPENFFFTQTATITTKLGTIYERIVNAFHVERSGLRLFWEGRPLADNDVLSEVCAISDEDRVSLELEFDMMPDFLRMVSAGEQVLRTIEVPVDYGDDVPSKTFFITMTKAFDRKPFLGGYRNIKSHVTYHHATTQTRVEREVRRDTTAKYSRVTQTQGVTRSVQTRRECGTQMSRNDVVVDTTFDRVVIAKPYFSADDLNLLRVKKAMKLQAFIRGWRARKLADALRQERDQEMAALRAEDESRRTAHLKKRQEEIQRRTHPRTAKDFAVLYNELEAWRLQETQRIHDTVSLTEGERRIALQELLKKETKLLQTIDRLQIHANRENRVASINNRLEKMSSAKTWGVTRTVQVETPSTIRARELRDLYNGLLLSGLSIDERLDVLLHVKWTVKEFDCPLTRDIIELIDREADLLNRGRKDGSLAQLRTRTANLFLQFIDTPEFNPEALAHQTVPLEYMPRPNVQLSRK